jgi:hypothetical protein
LEGAGADVFTRISRGGHTIAAAQREELEQEIEELVGSPPF